LLYSLLNYKLSSRDYSINKRVTSFKIIKSTVRTSSSSVMALKKFSTNNYCWKVFNWEY